MLAASDGSQTAQGSPQLTVMATVVSILLSAHHPPLVGSKDCIVRHRGAMAVLGPHCGAATRLNSSRCQVLLHTDFSIGQVTCSMHSNVSCLPGILFPRQTAVGATTAS